jgi:hypothetical protein
VNNTIRKLKLLGRTELTLVEITARRTVRSLAFAGLAVGLALLTILAVNGGAFFLLAERYSQATSAFLVAGGNAILALGILLAIKNTQPSREEVLARDIRDLARQELNTELDQMGSVFSKGAGLGAGLSIAGPIVEWAIGLLRKRRK